MLIFDRHMASNPMKNSKGDRDNKDCHNTAIHKKETHRYRQDFRC